jgi:NAD(P)-dependent dehydrogenase (short-subunit alcohol dehydrogenase family)
VFEKMTDPTATRLQGKVAIVTGGASGIGEATAHLFARHGARVVIADIQDDKGQQVAASIGSNRCTYFHCDVADEEQVKSMVDSTVQLYGKLDIMFSNAGVFSRSDQMILDLDLDATDRLFAVNVRGMAACVKHAARAMVGSGVKGSVVCTTSVVACRGSWKYTDYAVSKHAVLGLVRSASRQLGEYGIRVNGVAPSAVATPLLCDGLGIGAEDVEKFNEPFTCLKGVATVKHVADAVLFLASSESEFVTGHELTVDGGLKYQ